MAYAATIPAGAVIMGVVAAVSLGETRWIPVGLAFGVISIPLGLLYGRFVGKRLERGRAGGRERLFPPAVAIPAAIVPFLLAARKLFGPW